jgi:hypothetical protein
MSEDNTEDDKKNTTKTVIEGQVVPVAAGSDAHDGTRGNTGDHGEPHDRAQGDHDSDDAYEAGQKAAASTKAFLTDAGHALKDATHNLGQEIKKADSEGKFDKAKDLAGKAGDAVSDTYQKIVPKDAREDIADGTKKAGKAVKGFFKGLLG